MFERLDALVLKNRGGATAHVHGREVVAERLYVIHFAAKVLEIFASLPFLEEESMERTVGAERVAERNMRVEHVLVSFLRGRRILENNRIAVQIAAGVVIHHAVGKTDHPIGQELARLRDEVVSAGHEDAG